MAEPHDPADEVGLSPEQLEALGVLVESFSPGQRLLAARWLLSGFDTAALVEDRLETASAETREPEAALTVLYGSHSGHSAGVAKRLAAQASALGWSVTLANLADVSRGSLKQIRNLAVVVSTHGEGEPPESILPIFEYLQGPRAQPFKDCAFAVLGLGDKTYVHFCKAAADFDGRLATLGATRLLDCAKLDVDFQAGSEAWIDTALAAFTPRVATSPVTAVRPNRQVTKTRFEREHPWQAEVLDSVVLSGTASTQQFVHLELSLEGSRIKYLPGDALGVRPENDPDEVEQLILRLGVSADTEVDCGGARGSLRDALTRRLEIRQPTAQALQRYAAMGAPGLKAALATPEATSAYLQGRDWLDVLSEHPSEPVLPEFLGLLPEISSRSYSIASSQLAHPDEVHLLVSRVGYIAHGRTRRGVASGYLADRVQPGSKVAVWVESNRNFRLPEDQNVPLVMIGAGTGIAPFRSFMQARVAAAAKGKHWVVFGNRNFRSDFTYQTEWLAWRDSGNLSRMDVAFSRDQANKRYVTDALREQGKELYAWLESGAYLYLCGDRAKLSAAVDQAILDAVVTHGAKNLEAATAYLETLRTTGRYRKDVY